jgi:hypothetical protein
MAREAGSGQKIVKLKFPRAIRVTVMIAGRIRCTPGLRSRPQEHRYDFANQVRMSRWFEHSSLWLNTCAAVPLSALISVQAHQAQRDEEFSYFALYW